MMTQSVRRLTAAKPSAERRRDWGTAYVLTNSTTTPQFITKGLHHVNGARFKHTIQSSSYRGGHFYRMSFAPNTKSNDRTSHHWAVGVDVCARSRTIFNSCQTL